MRKPSAALVLSAVGLLGLAAAGALSCSDFSGGDAPAAPEGGAPPSDGGPGDAAQDARDSAAPLDAATSAYRAAVLGDGPIGYWRMGSVGGASDVPDEMGSSPLYLQGGGHVLAVPGAIATDDGDNKAIRFDGTTSYASVVDASAFDFANGAPFTIEVWGRRDVPDGGGDTFQNLVGKIADFDPAARGYLLYVAPHAENQTGGQISTPDAAVGVFGPLVPAGAWAHYALVFDGNKLTLYINGTAQPSKLVTAKLAVRSGDLVVGRDPREDNSYWPGAIDELAIYPKALTLMQLLTHYNLRQR
jgi:hypothetical protein